MTVVDPMVPNLFSVRKHVAELGDTFTVELKSLDGKGFSFQPGQFNMLYVHGMGEVPISISGDPADHFKLVHTVRAVGATTRALEALSLGATVGVRGPFGRPWPVEAAFGRDVVIVAGGIGLAPVRPIIYAVLAQREKFGKVVVLYGARTPNDVLYEDELHQWRGRFDMNVSATVDRADASWGGHVGVVTKLIERGNFDGEEAVAFMCGPEIMMRFAARSLMDRGLTEDRVYVSMERSMKCAVGFCGHCQWGGDFVCKDGPVFSYAAARKRLEIREF